MLAEAAQFVWFIDPTSKRRPVKRWRTAFKVVWQETVAAIRCDGINRTLAGVFLRGMSLFTSETSYVILFIRSIDRVRLENVSPRGSALGRGLHRRANTRHSPGQSFARIRCGSSPNFTNRFAKRGSLCSGRSLGSIPIPCSGAACSSNARCNQRNASSLSPSAT